MMSLPVPPTIVSLPPPPSNGIVAVKPCCPPGSVVSGSPPKMMSLPEPPVTVSLPVPPTSELLPLSACAARSTAARQRRGRVAAENDVVARATNDCVRSLPAGQRILAVANRAGNGIERIAAEESIVAQSADEDIVHFVASQAVGVLAASEVFELANDGDRARAVHRLRHTGFWRG